MSLGSFICMQVTMVRCIANTPYREEHNMSNMRFSGPLKQQVSTYLSVAKDFTRSPGPRYFSEGDFSGKMFREYCLVPHLHNAIAENKILIVDLDGTVGYACAFLEEAFGGLVRIHKLNLDLLRIISVEEPDLIDEIESYVYRAKADSNMAQRLKFK